jgi:hypothetical protein
VYATDLRNSSDPTPPNTCTFTVDSTAPGAPYITSPDYPQNATDKRITGGGEFDFFSHDPDDPADGGVTNVAKYAFNWGSPPPSINPPNVVAADANGNTKVTLTPTGLNNVLYVYAIDKAGNQSPTTHYDFNQEPPTDVSPAGDVTGDGKPDLVTPGPDGNLRLYQGLGNGQLAAPTLYASGSDFHGALIGTGDFNWNFVPDIVTRQADGNAYLYRGNGDTTPFSEDANSRALLYLPYVPDNPDDPNSTVSQPFAWSDVTQLAVASGNISGIPGDVDGDTNGPDMFVTTTDGTLWLLGAGSTDGSFNTATQLSTGWSGRTIVDAQGTDGSPALWVRDNATGQLDLYPGTADAYPGSDVSAQNKITSPTVLTSTAAPKLYPAGDTNGDGNSDLWTVTNATTANATYLPSTATAGSFGTAVHVTQAVSGLLNLADTADWNGDKNPDLIASDDLGTLWYYPGTGTGMAAVPQQITTGFTNWTYAGIADFNKDGYPDLIARNDANGELWLYPGDANHDLKSAPVKFDIGFTGITFAGVRDFNGDGKADIVDRSTDNRLVLFTGTGVNAGVNPGVQIGTGWGSYTFVGLGDFNRDGYSDVIVRDADGHLWYYTGTTGGHLTGDRVEIGHGWTGYTFAGTADWNKDGRIDIITRDSAGVLWLYPSDGATGFSPRTQLGTIW